MDSFDFIVLNIYMLAIFTLLIKSKTIVTIYRSFKFINLLLFSYMLFIFFSEKLYDLDYIIKVIPLFFLMGIVVQTEVLIVLKKVGIRKNSLFVNTLEDNIKIELIKSIDYLSSKRIGALISFEKNTPLDEFISSAYAIEAPLNAELLSTIFFPNTPLHDGAVIIRSNEIICAGAYFPPTERLDIPKQLGSRHRAAIGISEITDALTVVVSEQTGNISVAVDGYLDLDISKESLLLYLEKQLQK